MRALSAAVVGLSLVVITPAAHADVIDELGKRLIAFRDEAGNLASGIRKPSQVADASSQRAQRRLIDAQVAFGIGNYDDAAVMLYDYVEKHPDSPSFDEAMYYLAESLFQKQDYVASRSYFIRIVGERGPGSKFYQQSLERLIELSLKLHDSKDVDAWLTALDNVPPGKRRPSVPYVRGKYEYFKDNYDGALAEFSKVQPGSEYIFQAQYFAGACLVAKGDLAGASQLYAKIIKQPPKNNDDKRVIELSNMALGRLYYERDQPSKAIDQYLEINRRSDLFDEALYEVAWVYVKNNQYDKALRALELMALADPSSSRLPEVRILEGNLRIRKAQQLGEKNTGNSLEEYVKALRVFEITRDTFTKPHSELVRIMAEHSDPRAFMAQVTGRLSDTFDVNATLPEIAAAWIRDQPDVDRVVVIETDLGQIGDEIKEAEQTIDRLEAALASPSRVNIFPSLAVKRTRATEILEDIFSIRTQLATHERALVSRHASEAEKERLKQLQSYRQKVARDLAALPNAEVAYGERIERARNEYDQLDQKAAEVSTIIDHTRATLVALEKFIKDSVANGDAPASLQQYNSKLAELRGEVESMVSELAAIRREATLAKDEAGTGDEVAERAKLLRVKLRQALEDEHRYMTQIIGRLAGKDRTKGDQITSLTQTANAVSVTLDQVQRSIDEIVEAELTEVRSSLVEEKARLAAYKREFVTYEAESRELGGAILAESFVTVRDKFYDVLVRSDTGIVDVSWSQKEEVDEEARRLGLDKLRELKTLRDEFRDILEEEAAAAEAAGGKQ